jgi:hypothetical protein
MEMNNNHKAFLALVRAGLWEQDVWLLPFGNVDYEEVMRLAEEQAVVGLVTAGLEHVIDVKVPQEVLLQFVGETLQLEQQNISMNNFIESLIKKLRKSDVYTLLVKGQGIAQCYERPLWRASGDIDFFLSENNFNKAKEFLLPLSSTVDGEKKYNCHLAMTIDAWVVELHGNLHCGLWKSVDNTLDEIQDAVFNGGNIRFWMNGNTVVFLPRPDEDIVYVFAHILQHFFKEGIGLRQICDWCRLVWTFNSTIDHKLLAKRLKKMGVLSEWMAFAALAVNWLGMPKDSIPFFSNEEKWSKKANKLLLYIFESGNFGHNKDYSHNENSHFLVRKVVSLGRHASDGVNFFAVFPLDSLRMWRRVIVEGIKEVL